MIIPVSYLQSDSKWGSKIYSRILRYDNKGNPIYHDKTQTISSSGCGPTAAAMVAATLFPIFKSTPETACIWSMKNGYRSDNEGTLHSFFKPYLAQFGITCKQITPSNLRKMSTSVSKPYKEKLITNLKNGKWAICCMGEGLWTKGGHYILAYGVDSNNKVLIRDPASTRTDRTHGNMTTFLNEIKHYWLIDIPNGDKKDEVDDMTSDEVKKIIKEDKRYIKDIKDAPADFQPILKELQAKGILKGTGIEEVGMSYEAVRLIIITYRMLNYSV